MAQALHGRIGANFTVRITTERRAALERKRLKVGGPPELGPWLLWYALQDEEGSAPAPWQAPLALNLTVEAKPVALTDVPIGKRIILDLCGGSGSWSAPYRAAGYPVEVVTLPERDVRTFVPPPFVWGVVAAPPCEKFLAHPTPLVERDLVAAMEVVNACLRIIYQCRPRWLALENPVGLLSKFLGTPRDVWEPYEFGDPWSKRTAIWGEFCLPKRGPWVQEQWGGGPACTEGHGDPRRRSSRACHRAACRAKTPGGFARAFAEANP